MLTKSMCVRGQDEQFHSLALDIEQRGLNAHLFVSEPLHLPMVDPPKANCKRRLKLHPGLLRPKRRRGATMPSAHGALGDLIKDGLTTGANYFKRSTG